MRRLVLHQFPPTKMAPIARTPNAAKATARFKARGIAQTHFLSRLTNIPTRAITMPRGATQNPAESATGTTRMAMDFGLPADVKAKMPTAYATSDTARHPSEANTKGHLFLSSFIIMQNVGQQAERTRRVSSSLADLVGVILFS